MSKPQSEFPTKKEAIYYLIDAGYRPSTKDVWRNKSGDAAYLSSFVDQKENQKAKEVGWFISWPVNHAIPEDHAALREKIGGRAWQ